MNTTEKSEISSYNTRFVSRAGGGGNKGLELGLELSYYKLQLSQVEMWDEIFNDK